MASRARQRLDYALLYTLFLLARPLPRRALLFLGRRLGQLVHSVFRFRRGIVLDNLTRALGSELSPAQINAVAVSFYCQLGMTLMEFLSLPRLNRKQVLELVDIQGGEHLQRVLDEGKGGLLVSGHFGNWEMLGARIAASGHKIHFVVKSQANAQVDAIQNEIRGKVGIGIIRTDGGIKEIIQALRRGEFIAMLADQDAGKDGLFTDFLGRQASVFKGPAYLAWKLRCPLITGHILRRPDGRHLTVVEEPVFPDPAWDEEEAVRRLSEIHVQRLAAAVRKNPDHYYWLHRRWKTRPPEEKE
jgi:KDO2-lipid IV(A) lauroyltransferase